MRTRYKLAIGAGVVIVSFASGRFTTPDHTITIVKTVEIEKKTTDTDTKRDKKKKTTITEEPDGTKKTVIDEETTTDKSKKETSDTSKTTDTSKDKETGSKQLTTLAIGGGYNISSQLPTLGISAYRPILGPIGIGLQVTAPIAPTGIQLPQIGASIGVSF